MADAVATITHVRGKDRFAYTFLNTSDGTGESAVSKIDISAINSTIKRICIESIQYDIQGFDAVELLFDHATDTTAAKLGAGQGSMDFYGVGGLSDTDSTVDTGDLLLTTLGTATSGDTYTITVAGRFLHD